MSYKSQHGFTLIELMIVVTIIGILASLSIFVYHQYIVRARITEGLVLVASLKNLVLENAASGSVNADGGLFKGMPTAPGNASACSAPGTCSLLGGGGISTNVTSVVGNTLNGSIVVTFAPNASGTTLELWPSAQGAALAAGTVPIGVVSWTCFSAGKAQTAGSNHAATMPSRFAPTECR